MDISYKIGVDTFGTPCNVTHYIFECSVDYPILRNWSKLPKSPDMLNLNTLMREIFFDGFIGKQLVRMIN